MKIRQATLPVPAGKIKLAEQASIEQAFQAIVWNCLEQIELNLAGIAPAYHAESLHQLRVGLRRLRVALSIFKARMKVPAVIVDELTWLSRQLNPARDWDVFLSATLPKLTVASSEPAGLAELRHCAEQAAAAEHGAAAAAINSERCELFLLNLVLWMHGCGWRDALSEKAQRRLQHPVLKFAGKQIGRRQQQLLTTGRKLRLRRAKSLHRIRIRAKQVRYTMEFFVALFPSKGNRNYLKNLSKIQDQLGCCNDVAVAKRLMKKLRERHNQLTSVSLAVRGQLGKMRKREQKKIRQRWKKFNK